MSTDASNVLLAMADGGVVERCAESIAPPHAVRTVSTGEAAIDVLRTGRVDVLVPSRLRPDYGAEAVLREVRSRELSCRVVMVDDESDIDRFDGGGHARLARPFTATDLRGVVGTLATPGPREAHRHPHAAPDRRGELS